MLPGVRRYIYPGHESINCRANRGKVAFSITPKEKVFMTFYLSKDIDFLSGVPKNFPLSRKKIRLSKKEPHSWIRHNKKNYICGLFYGTEERFWGHPISSNIEKREIFLVFVSEEKSQTCKFMLQEFQAV